MIPGYPQWLSVSGGAQFNDEVQKRTFQKYWEEALPIDDPIVREMLELSKQYQVMLMGGILERENTSLYCTLLTIENGKLLGRHRKIKPTYEERLVWSDGDAKGLKVYDTLIGKIGGLNCWENWLPLARASLHRQGEVIHVAVWPGSIRNTLDITKFIALEGRSWVISVSGMLGPRDIQHLNEDEFPVKDLVSRNEKYWNNGGSMIVNPKGEVISGPMIDEEGIIYADLDQGLIIRERQNLDISGHYSRFDIFNFSLNTENS